MSLLNFAGSKTISEGYGRTVDATYHGQQVTDPRPNILALGRWTNHKGTPLLCGLNLNYLSPEQIQRLRTGLASILSDRNLRRRVRMVRSEMPDIFGAAYRTYNSDAVNIIAPGTLKFLKSAADLPGAVQQANKPQAGGPGRTGAASQAEPTGEPQAVQPEAPDGPMPSGIKAKVTGRHDGMRQPQEKPPSAPDIKKAIDRLDQLKEPTEDPKARLNDEPNAKPGEDITRQDLQDLEDFEEGQEDQDSGPR